MGKVFFLLNPAAQLASIYQTKGNDGTDAMQCDSPEHQLNFPCLSCELILSHVFYTSLSFR